MKTISKETAIRLKEVADKAGFELPESERLYVCTKSGKCRHDDSRFFGESFTNVYSTDELLEILKPKIYQIEVEQDEWSVGTVYEWDGNCGSIKTFEHEEFYEALANLYIYLIENKLI